jgi:Mg-chelatase subunit ChlD
LSAVAGLGLFALATRGSSAPEDPPCAIGAFDLGPNGEEMAGPAVPPGAYKLYKKMKGGAWMTSKPFELQGGHRYLFNASACLTEDGGAASFSRDPAFTKPYSKPLADEAVVHYQNTDMANWIALTVCPVPGSSGEAPPCTIDTEDQIAGIESPGRIVTPGKYKIFVREKGKAWIASQIEELRGGHRYLVDVTRVTDKGSAGFREDDVELGRYSKPNPDEVVVHYKTPVGITNPYSATVCQFGTDGAEPPCTIDTTDMIAGIESPGRMIPPGTYILYSKVKGKAWVSSAPGDLRGGHRYLVDISRQTQDGSPGFSEDDVALLKYDKPNAGEVVVHYKTPMGISDPISATVCVQGAIPVTPTVEGTKITIKTAGTDCLDLIFVIDLTGSMGDDIAQVKRTALDILNTIKGSFANFRMGFVGYKDWSDGADIFKDMPFTNSFDDITALINGLTTGGGGDEPEAVLEALLRALRMPWRNGCNKQIILMGDAPPHDPILKGPDAGKTASDVVQLAKDVDPAVINSIVISKTPGSISEDARKSFEDLAKRTGGIMTTADKAEEVPLKIKEVVGVIKATAAAAPPVAPGGGGGPVLPAAGLSPAVIAALVILGAAFILVLAIVIVRRRGASPAEPVVGSTGSRIRAGLDVAYADGGIKPFRITSARTTIGRGPDNLLVLRDTQISTHHAEILASPDGFLLRDLESANGTTVNGQPVTEAYLKIGDDIGIGTTHLTFTE